MAWTLAAPLGGVTDRDYLELLLRLLPDGYSDDPDGPRVTELEAYAKALWIGRVAIDRAIAQAFPDRATEMLDELERAYGLPNDAARSIEQRQARLAAALKIGPAARFPRRQLVGLHRFSPDDFLKRNDGTLGDGLEGSTSMTRSVLLLIERQPDGNNYCFAADDTGTEGWGLRVALFGGGPAFGMQFRVYAGTTLVAVSSAPLDVGRPYVVTVAYDGAQMRMKVNSDVSVVAAHSGTVVASGGGLGIGARNEAGNEPASAVAILGVAATDDRALSDSEMLAFNRDVLKAGQMLAMPGCQHLYRPPELGVDLIGDLDFTTEGSPVATTFSQRFTRISAALQTIDDSALVLVNSRSHVEAAAALDEMVWKIGVALDDEAFDAPATRRAIGRVMRKIMPARLHSVQGFRLANAEPSPREETEHLLVNEGVWWGSTEARLGRDAIARQDETTFAVRAPDCRLVEYSGLKRLDAADLNAIQDATLMEPCAAAGGGIVDDYPDAGRDMAIVHFAMECPNGVATVIDGDCDWRDRYVMTWLRHSTTDIRPGQAGDATAAGSAVRGLWSSMDGETTALATGDRWGFASNLILWADLSNGALTLYNTTGSTVYAVGTMVASPDLGLR